MSDSTLTGDLFAVVAAKSDTDRLNKADRLNKLVEMFGQHILEPMERKCEKRNHIARLHALCQIVGAKFKCSEDHEGGGYMRIEFPRNAEWTTERAESYVMDVMKLSLGNSYRGAGQSFMQCNTYQRNGHGDWPVISWRWGYDI